MKPYVPSVPSFIDVDDELQRLLEDDVELPDLSDTTYDTLAQRLPHQVDTAFDALPDLKATVIKLTVNFMTMCLRITLGFKMSSLPPHRLNRLSSS